MENKNELNIKKLIADKDVYAIRDYVEQTPLNDVIFDFNELNELESVLFFRFLKTDFAGEFFSHLSEEMKQTIVQNLTKKEVTDIINELYTDEIADLLEALPADMAKTILLSVDKTTRLKVNQLLQFEDDEIGSIMSVDLIILHEDLTNAQALDLIQQKRKESEIGQYYYVVNKKNELLGSTTLEDIVFSDKNKLIKEKLQKTTPVYTKQSKEEAARIFASENYSALPVISQNGVLMGMLTSDDVIDILNTEANIDLYKASGISVQRPTQPYFKTTFFELVKLRVFWLVILMIGSTLSQVIIQYLSNGFDKVIESAGVSTALMIALIPVTSATSGNAGSQSTSTLTRAVFLGEIKEGKKMLNVLGKEILTGLILGLILGIFNFVRLCVYYGISQDIINHTKFILLISLVSSISLFISITLAKCLGTLILIIGLKAKKDPAVMSAPLLTTLIDGLSTLVFFALGYIILVPMI